MFKRTYDTAYIHKCLTDPYVWSLSSDDRCPPPDLLFVDVKIPVFVKAGDYGLFMANKLDDTTYEVHVALHRSAIGKAEELSLGAIKWFFENFRGCESLEAHIPAYNYLAQGLARRIGFRFCFIHKGVFQKNGRKYDKHIYILNRGQICQAQQQQQGSQSHQWQQQQARGLRR